MKRSTAKRSTAKRNIVQKMAACALSGALALTGATGALALQALAPSDAGVVPQAQAAAGNTVRASAQTIGLNQSVTGTFDYNADGGWESYYYKFQTSNRRASYRVVLDSLNGRSIRCEITTEYNNGWGGYGSYFYTSSRDYQIKSDCDYNAWFYVKVSHDSAKRYDQYRLTVEELPDVSNFSVGGIASSYAYKGADICPQPTVTYGGSSLRRNVDYTLSWSNNKDLGTATVTVTGTGKYSGSVSKNFNIVNAKNKMTAKARKATVTVKRSKIKKSWSGYTISSNIKVKKAKGDISYSNASKNKKAKKMQVSSYDGKVTIPKSTKKGTYNVRVKVKDAGSYGYKAKTAYVSYKIKVV